ncbi:ankyrin repeat domain-containing protein 45 isoform X3 [Anolis carolinensis]|uniref:ankyrin repeat domain-containing protein 45 isoform X3 n=1 Tax=Anolis carolinensis TaxID=28377 RepID=UPI002F2B815F
MATGLLFDHVPEASSPDVSPTSMAGILRGCEVCWKLGYTLLHCAAAWGQLETLKTLIDLEADIYATTFRGEKARDIACRYEKMECVEFLDWAEAKQNLRNFISQIQTTVTDPEKVLGRLNKEDKVAYADITLCIVKGFSACPIINIQVHLSRLARPRLIGLKMLRSLPCKISWIRNNNWRTSCFLFSQSWPDPQTHKARHVFPQARNEKI